MNVRRRFRGLVSSSWLASIWGQLSIEGRTVVRRARNRRRSPPFTLNVSILCIYTWSSAIAEQCLGQGRWCVDVSVHFVDHHPTPNSRCSWLVMVGTKNCIFISCINISICSNMASYKWKQELLQWQWSTWDTLRAPMFCSLLSIVVCVAIINLADEVYGQPVTFERCESLVCFHRILMSAFSFTWDRPNQMQVDR